MSDLLHTLGMAAARWWPYVVHAAWQATLVAVVALVIVRLGRRWPSPLRYWLLVLALVKFAVPPLLSMPTGILSSVGPRVVVSPKPEMAGPPWETVVARSVRDEAPLDAMAGAERATPAGREGRDVAETVVGVNGSADFRRGIQQSADSRRRLHPSASSPRRLQSASIFQWKLWLLLIHAAGAGLIAFWILLHWRRLGRTIARSQSVETGPAHDVLAVMCDRLGVRRRPRLLVSSGVSAPVAFGFLRPAILFPRSLADSLSPDDLQTVLAHELAHHRRRDPLWNWVQLLLSVVWWFHPVFWLLSRQIRRVREDCCDDLVLARGLTSSESYCRTLISAASRLAPPVPAAAALGFAETLHPLGRRIRRIMDSRLARAAGLSVVGFIVLVILATVFLPGLETRERFHVEGDPLEIRLVGLRPNGGDEVFDLEGEKIGERLNTGQAIAGQNNGERQVCDLIFALPETDAPIQFDRFFEVRAAGNRRRVGTSQRAEIEQIDGQRQLVLSLRLPQTYEDYVRIFGIVSFHNDEPLEAIDLTMRYYCGPRQPGRYTFSGPLAPDATVSADEDASVTLQVVNYHQTPGLRGGQEAKFDIACAGRPPSSPRLTIYDASGRRHLGSDLRVWGLRLEEIALVVVGEPIRERHFRNIPVLPPGHRARANPAFLDRMAERLGLESAPPEEVAEYEFHDRPRKALAVIDVVRGYDHMRRAWEAIRYANPRLRFDELATDEQERLRATARTWMASPDPQAAVWGLEMGLCGGWPEFFAPAMDALASTRPLGLLRNRSGRWYAPELAYASYSNGFFRDLPILASSHYDDLSAAQLEQVEQALLAARDRSTLGALYRCLVGEETAFATGVLQELAQDPRPWIWLKAVYELHRRGALPPDDAASVDLQQRLAVARLVFESGKQHPPVDPDVGRLLAGLVTADAQAMHSSVFPFDNILRAVGAYCDRETARTAYVRFLREVEPDMHSCWAIDRVVKRINFDYKINIGGLGTDFVRQSSPSLERDFDWPKIIADALQWHETGEVPGRHSPEETITLRFPDEQSLGTIDVTGFGERAARGTVELPAWAHIRFTVNRDASDFDGLSQLAPFTITWMHLGGSKIHDTHLRALDGFTSLSHLGLSETAIGDEGVAHLKGLTSLKQIYLKNCQVTDKGMAALGELENLRRLDLRETSVTKAGLASLNNKDTIAILALDGCPIGDEGLVALKTFPVLRDLSLRDCGLTDAGLVHFKDFPALTNLLLGRNEITNAGVKHLQGLSRLGQLYLDHTEVGDAGLAFLADLTELHSLNLGETNVTDAGLKHLAGLPALRTLTLSNCRITDAGVETLKTFPALGYVDLRQTDVSQDAMKDLKGVRPNFTVMGLRARSTRTTQ